MKRSCCITGLTIKTQPPPPFPGGHHDPCCPQHRRGAWRCMGTDSRLCESPDQLVDQATRTASQHVGSPMRSSGFIRVVLHRHCGWHRTTLRRPSSCNFLITSLGAKTRDLSNVKSPCPECISGNIDSICTVIQYTNLGCCSVSVWTSHFTQVLTCAALPQLLQAGYGGRRQGEPSVPDPYQTQPCKCTGNARGAYLSRVTKTRRCLGGNHGYHRWQSILLNCDCNLRRAASHGRFSSRHGRNGMPGTR